MPWKSPRLRFPRVVPKIDPTWKKAVDDVVGSTLHAQVRMLAMGAHLPNATDYKTLEKGVLAMLPDAKTVYGSNKCKESGCTCRHRALLWVNACGVSQMAPVDAFETFAMSVRHLEQYMSRVVN